MAGNGNFKYGKEFIVKRLRAQWLDIFTPGDAMEDGGTPKFKLIGLMEPDSAASKLCKQEMLTVAKEMWGDNATEVVKNMTANSKALRNGNGKIDDAGNVRPEFKNMHFLSASNKTKPRVVGPARVEIDGELHFVDIQEDGTCLINGKKPKEEPYEITVPYRGCYVNAKVKMVAGKSFKSPKDGKIIPNQVFCQLIAIQFVEDGEPFGPGANSADGFEDETPPPKKAKADSGDDLMDDDDDIPF